MAVAKANNTVQGWTKPVLTKLGKLADVAGPKTVSSNGASAGFANS